MNKMNKSLFRSCTLGSLTRTLSLGLVALTPSAFADTFSIQYFEVPTGSADFYAGVNVPLGISTNYVSSTLGADGLPVFNPGFTASSGTVYAPNSIYRNASDELLYWSPSNPNGGHVIADGTGTISLSSTPVSMFAPGANGNDSTYEETAIISGYFTVPTGDTDSVTFRVGADDSAYVYVDGSLVESLGGIHANTAVPSNTIVYGPGTHQIELFYADRDPTNAALSFTDSDNLAITSQPVPELGTILLLGTGLLFLAAGLRSHAR